MGISRKYKTWVILSVFLTLGACSKKPGENTAKQVLQNLLKDSAEVLSAKKISGKGLEISDPESKNGYQMEIEAQIKHLRNVPKDFLDEKMKMFNLTVDDLEMIESAGQFKCRQGERKKIKEKFLVFYYNKKPSGLTLKNWLIKTLTRALYGGECDAVMKPIAKVISVEVIAAEDATNNNKKDANTTRIVCGFDEGWLQDPKEIRVGVEAEIEGLVDIPNKYWELFFLGGFVGYPAHTKVINPSPREIWQHKKGDVEIIKRSLTFKKTEKGWKGEDENVY